LKTQGAESVRGWDLEMPILVIILHLRRPRKTDIEGVDVTCWDRLFQVQAAATGKARSPTVDSRVYAHYDGHSATVRKQIGKLLGGVSHFAS